MGAVKMGDANPAEAMNDARIQHTEFRDDRFVAAVKLNSGQKLTLFYRARVVTPGSFIVPPLYAEDMYRPSIFGLSGGGNTLTVSDAPRQRKVSFIRRLAPLANRALAAVRQRWRQYRLWVNASTRRRWTCRAVLALLLTVTLLDLLFPLPQPGRTAPAAMVVVARDGTPLRAFPDQQTRLAPHHGTGRYFAAISGSAGHV